MATTEPTINDALANELRKTRRAWGKSDIIKSENTGTVRDKPSSKPDILIIEPNTSPVVIEAEIFPATNVEREAQSRLGEIIEGNGRKIFSAVAVNYPESLRSYQGDHLFERLREEELRFALFTGRNPDIYERWPRSGWIIGGIIDLSILIQAASVPPEVIDQAVNYLINGISECAIILDESSIDNPGAIDYICSLIYQENNYQTRAMAMTMLVNAIVFQETLSGGKAEFSRVLNIAQMRHSVHGLSKSVILEEWSKILKINYWPIFDIARKILEAVPSTISVELCEKIAFTAEKLVENRLMRSHDLTGAVFQRLISDRKLLAAFYTTPASAAFLVGLTLSPKHINIGRNWSNEEDVKSLRVADFACGTGTLLSTIYQKIGQFHEMAGGEADNLHAYMMENSIIGCDILPAAAHLTASMLSGSHPTITYEKSGISTIPYGRKENGEIALGSLDLLDNRERLDILDFTVRRIEGQGESQAIASIMYPDKSFDIVIMNPPFTRATGHEGAKLGIPIPMFAALGTTEKDQREMSAATNKLIKNTSAHGNAGEASMFLVLADRKVKQEGIISLVLPLPFISGEAWIKSRELIKNNYSEIIITSIAGKENRELSFSADTGMGECLVVAKKTNVGSTRATFVVLFDSPKNPVLSWIASRQVLDLINNQRIRNLEDGPIGGTPLVIGNDIIGSAINAPIDSGENWKMSRIIDFSLAQTAYSLADTGKLWLPGKKETEAYSIPMTTVENIGLIGPYHMDIEANNDVRPIRGPFILSKNDIGAPSTYPILWAHDAQRERTMNFEADYEGLLLNWNDAIEKTIVEEKAFKIMQTASHSHFNRDFRFNSQSTSMQYTKRKTIGGHAWMSIKLDDSDMEKAIVLWSNTTLGLLLYWWHSSKQQNGRGRIGITALHRMPILNIRALEPEKIKRASELFDQFHDKPLLPFNELDKDETRIEMDKHFIRDVLDIYIDDDDTHGALSLLREKLCNEPSVHGQKKTRVGELYMI